MNTQSTFINPYHKYGELHNEGLDFVITKIYNKYPASLSKIDKMDIITFTSIYINKILCNCSNHDKTDDLTFRQAQLFELFAKTFNDKSNIDELCKNANLSDNLTTHLRYIFNSPFDNHDLNQGVSHFDILEKNVLKSNLNDNEKNSLLFILSISKASANYVHDPDKKLMVVDNLNNSLRKEILEKIVKANSIVSSPPLPPALDIPWYKRWSWKKDGKGALKGLIGDTKDTLVEKGTALIKNVGVAAVASEKLGISCILGASAGLLLSALGSAIVDSAEGAFNLDE